MSTHFPIKEFITSDFEECFTDTFFDIINSQNNNIENQKRSIEEKKNQLKEIFDKNEDRLVDKFFNIITE